LAWVHFPLLCLRPLRGSPPLKEQPPAAHTNTDAKPLLLGIARAPDELLLMLLLGGLLLVNGVSELFLYPTAWNTAAPFRAS
jgi:hypothetical protein